MASPTLAQRSAPESALVSFALCGLASGHFAVTALLALSVFFGLAPSGSFRPSTQTRAPSWAKTPAMPLPMPLVPPVTMTDLFLIDVSTESSLFTGRLVFGKPANEKEISHGRVRLQTLRGRFAMGTLASSIG